MNKIKDFIKRKYLLLIIIILLISNLWLTYLAFDATFVPAKDDNNNIVKVPLRKALESIVVGEQQILGGLKETYNKVQSLEQKYGTTQPIQPQTENPTTDGTK